MEELSVDILKSGEIEAYVQSLQPSKIEDLATPLWVESHHRFQKLSQQSAVEAGEMREECVKDFIISYGKVSVLIHEAICIQVWREKIFCQILKLKNQLQHSFLIYIILFHEITVLNLLQNVLYHKDSMQELGDTVIDLIDYCASEIVRLLSEDYTKLQESAVPSSNAEEIISQSKTISFNVGLTALCILRYLIEFLEDLSLSAISRLYKTHDVPVLLTNLILISPWKRINPKTNIVQVYEDRTWKNIDKISGISKYEGQCWIALTFILLNDSCKCQYELTDFRKQHLLKIQKFLSETILDQIPPLINLKQFLAQLAISSFPCKEKRPLIMETIPEIKSQILRECMKKWKKIAAKQIELLFNSKQDIMMEVAKRLGETYDLDHLEKLFPEGPVCSNCGDAAAKRCSKCKNEWYCGRECQVKRWPKHKTVCDVMSRKQGEGDG